MNHPMKHTIGDTHLGNDTGGQRRTPTHDRERGDIDEDRSEWIALDSGRTDKTRGDLIRTESMYIVGTVRLAF